VTETRERTRNPPTEAEAQPVTISEAARLLAEAMAPRKFLRNPAQEVQPESPEVTDAGAESGDGLH
jgi:hypothetical protein